jgi:hypothetical protein
LQHRDCQVNHEEGRLAHEFNQDDCTLGGS